MAKAFQQKSALGWRKVGGLLGLRQLRSGFKTRQVMLEICCPQFRNEANCSFPGFVCFGFVSLSIGEQVAQSFGPWLNVLWDIDRLRHMRLIENRFEALDRPDWNDETGT